MSRGWALFVAIPGLALLGGNTVATPGVVWTVVGGVMILFAGVGLGLIAPTEVRQIVIGGGDDE